MKFKIFFDEAWRWPLAWPVVVGWIVKLDEIDESIFKDSKKLSEKKREAIFKQIQTWEKEKKLIYWFWFASNNEIDDFGIVPSINFATQRALIMIFYKYIEFFEENILPSPHFIDWDKLLIIQKLKQLIKDFTQSTFLKPQSSYLVTQKIIQNFNQLEKLHWLIFDGNTDFGLSKDLWFKIITVIKWDGKVPLIWAASIIAKVTRDNRMKKIALEYPQYNFEKHKGYGTVAHRQAISLHGPCKLHRKSFIKW